MTTDAAARTVLARRLELAATIVMAAAAIFTAWAAFQSAKWSGIMSIEFARANAARVESTRLDDRASQLTAIDVDVFVAWLEAVDSEIRQGVTVIDPDGGYQPVDGTLSAFVYQRMRPEFLPALEAWLDTRPLSNPDAPKTPFALDEYEPADAVAADEQLTAASGHTEAALVANQNSDNHVLTAVALSLSIFFAGISGKMEFFRNQIKALGLAAVIFVGAGLVLIILPKVSPF